MKIGDTVTRNSYHHDLQFRIKAISDNKVSLSGLYYRLAADADINDLSLCDPVPIIGPHIENQLESADTRGFINDLINWNNDDESESNADTFDKLSKYSGNSFVKILHIDGNKYYLKESLAGYHNLGLPVVGLSIPEEKQSIRIWNLLIQYRPNILVITGHDAINRNKTNTRDINAYLNTKYFVESVKIARKFNADYDKLVIIAGGCKSYYEELMGAGANFASSPERVLINVTEPVSIACKIATTSIKRYVTMSDIEPLIPSGISGFGGLETRGQWREITPPFSLDSQK